MRLMGCLPLDFKTGNITMVGKYIVSSYIYALNAFHND